MFTVSEQTNPLHAGNAATTGN